MMNLASRLILEDRRKPRRILFAGDAMTDVYVWGNTTLCQDGCDKFVEKGRVEVPGGAANAARSIDRWLASRMCPYNPDSCQVKTRFTVSDQIVFRHDAERLDRDQFPLQSRLIEALETWGAEGVLISDYDKGLLTPDFIRHIIDWCEVRGVPCVADVKRDAPLYRGAIIKGNAEWWRTRSVPIGTRWVMTSGADLPTTSDGYQCGPHHQPRVRCVNHVGAGDCFAAHLTLALACDFSLKEAAIVAHAAGRVYVQRRHNCPPHPDEVVRDLDGLPLDGDLA